MNKNCLNRTTLNKTKQDKKKKPPRPQQQTTKLKALYFLEVYNSVLKIPS